MVAGEWWSALTPEQVLQLPQRIFCRGHLFHITPAVRKNESDSGRVNHVCIFRGFFLGHLFTKKCLSGCVGQ